MQNTILNDFQDLRRSELVRLIDYLSMTHKISPKKSLDRIAILKFDLSSTVFNQIWSNSELNVSFAIYLDLLGPPFPF